MSGDEKLWRFTGESGWVRLVESKPDKIGHWIYTLCVKVFFSYFSVIIQSKYTLAAIWFQLFGSPSRSS